MSPCHSYSCSSLSKGTISPGMPYLSTFCCGVDPVAVNTSGVGVGSMVGANPVAVSSSGVGVASRVGVDPVAVNTASVGVGSMVDVGAAGLCAGIESACEQPLAKNALKIRMINGRAWVEPLSLILVFLLTIWRGKNPPPPDSDAFTTASSESLNHWIHHWPLCRDRRGKRYVTHRWHWRLAYH